MRSHQKKQAEQRSRRWVRWDPEVTVRAGETRRNEGRRRKLVKRLLKEPRESKF